MSRYKTGIGYDIHKLAEGRKLILGGVPIPSKKGPVGHSDADVLVHAICDALLGAASMGDIGEHFPDTDPQYKDISSLTLLEKVAEFIYQKNFSIIHIDGVLILDAPKITPFKKQMQQTIARVLQISLDAVNIKATTSEGTYKDTISAYTVATVQT